jgi:hypothetical protein
MKTIITFLTTAVLAVGATSAISGAMAAGQDTDDAAGYALSQQAARGVAGAYASVRETRQVHSGAVHVPAAHDFQLDGR